MLSIIGALPQSAVNPFKSFSLDDKYSKINRIFLFAVCLLFGFVITLNDYAGQKIVCHGFTTFNGPFAENYCWVQGLYTILEAYDLPTKNLPYPGIIPETTACFDFIFPNGTLYKCPDEGAILPMTRVYHIWYQWIPFYFWMCAVVFYLPYVLFHNSDIGQLKPVLKLLINSVDSEEEEEQKLNKAVTWLSKKMTMYLNATGPIQFFLVSHKFFFIILINKIANLGCVVLVLFLTDKVFVISSYLTYGLDWISYIGRDSESVINSPIDKLFPKMIACEIKKWGTTGIQEENGMCVLAPNVVNSYFFLIFWFILVLGLLANAFSVLFTTTIHLFTLGRWKALLTSTFLRDTSIGKWVYFNSGTSGQITMDILAQNVSSTTFETLYVKVCHRVATKDKSGKSFMAASKAPSLF